nr:MAG TPA: hypothetical protein [Caudoviricetes sp.]
MNRNLFFQYYGRFTEYLCVLPSWSSGVSALCT